MRLAALAILWFSCFAGEIAYDLSPPETSDSASCGAMDAPITDFDHYLVNLYRCGVVAPFATFNLPGDTDSVRFAVSDGIVGWTQVWAVDRSGNQSCRYLSNTWASPAVAILPPPPQDTTIGIAPHYYIGTSRGGQAIIGSRTNIDFSWALGSPISSIPADGWSADWSGMLTIPTTGAYTFYLKSEDGGQVFIGGTLGINHYGIQPLTEWTWATNLTAGDKPITVTYMANNGNSECHLLWSGPGLSKQIVPRGALR